MYAHVAAGTGGQCTDRIAVVLSFRLRSVYGRRRRIIRAVNVMLQINTCTPRTQCTYYYNVLSILYIIRSKHTIRSCIIFCFIYWCACDVYATV